jgi:hypothetical protein
MRPERFRGRTVTEALAAVRRARGDETVLLDTTGVGPSHMALLAEAAAIARVSGAHARRTLVVTEADCAPWEPIASQITGHAIAVRAVARSRSVADSLAPVSRGGLARRLLAA